MDVGRSVIACGHAIGAIGSELTTKLIRSTRWDGLNLGIVTLCIGGPGNKLAIEMLPLAKICKGTRAMDIGFAGLGNMGKGIAQSLIKAGHRLRVWNRSPGPVEELRKLGAEVVPSPQHAFGGDAFVSMLADDAALREVLLDGNALPNAGVDTVHVCMATISVAFARELTALHRARKIPFVSAPVLGRPDTSATGKLTILAAGDPTIVKRVQPLLDAAGEKTWCFGAEPSNANVVKIAANFMLASAIEAIAEARALVEANDIPADQFLNLITSTLFDAPVYKGYGGVIARRQYEPAGFKLTIDARRGKQRRKLWKKLALATSPEFIFHSLAIMSPRGGLRPRGDTAPPTGAPTRDLVCEFR